jgi:isoleucyl-tRNA synthetase
MLANLAGFEESERLPQNEMPELERFVLARVAELDAQVRESYAAFDFNRVYTSVFNFATSDLSAFYFDIRKDALYCDARYSARRRAVRTVLDELFRRLTTWLSPILCFTMEEAWTAQFPDDGQSVHLQTIPDAPKTWMDSALLEKWQRIRALRRVVTGALEIARAGKSIGASLEAAPVLYLESTKDEALFKSVSLSEITITSNAVIQSGAAPSGAFRLPDVAGAGVIFAKAEGEKCARCWMVLPEVGANKDHPDICNRCADAVS